MSKKKKKSSAAENLIESLMDDVKGIQSDALFSTGEEDAEHSGLPLPDEYRADDTNANGGLWEDLGKGLEKDLDSSEFNGTLYGSNEEVSEYEGSDSGIPEEEKEYDVPEGFEVLPEAKEGPYQGPSFDGGYQSPDDLFAAAEKSSVSEDSPFENNGFDPEDEDSTRPIGSSSPFSGHSSTEDKTVSLQNDMNHSSSVMSGTDIDKTVAVEGFANARARKSSEVDVKVSIGNFRGGGQGRGPSNVLTSIDASLAQSENLKLAQQRILELEKECEILRAENEELASAGEIIRSRTDDLHVRISSLEKEKAEVHESAQSELLILKGNLQYKENEVAKARIKIEELDTRLKSDFKKIRVRERELENRLELLRAEKAALVRSKDEYILDQKRKIDQLSQELDNYRKKCLELNKTIEATQDQFKRTERALRLALSNLEVKEENLVPLKKAD